LNERLAAAISRRAQCEVMTSVTGLANSSRPTAAAEPASGVRLLLAWGGVFVAALLLYSLTASTSIGWQDSGDFVNRIVRGSVTDPYGLCRAHPLHFWAGTFLVKILPLEPPASMALLSAIFGALAVANVFGIVRTLTKRADAALLAALGLAVAHSFWRFSTCVEVYSISAAMLTAEVWALVLWDQTRRQHWLVLMFLANGLGLANHDLALLTLPVIGIVLLIGLFTRQASWKTVVASAVAWVLGAGVFLYMIAQEARTSHSIVLALRSALFGTFESQILSHGPLLRYTAISIAFTALSFPNLMLPAALWGAVRGRRMLGAISYWGLLAATASHLLFVLRYAIIDQYTFLVPVYALLAVWAGLGFTVVLTQWPASARRVATGLAVATIAFTPVVYVVACDVTRHYHVLGSFARNKPYRDDYRYLFIPWSRGENSARQMSEEAVRLAGGNGVVVAEDEMAIFALEYQQAMHPDRNLTLISPDDHVDWRTYADGRRPIVFVPFNASNPPPPTPSGAWVRVGDLYELQFPPTTRPSGALGRAGVGRQNRRGMEQAGGNSDVISMTGGDVARRVFEVPKLRTRIPT
jgi:transmembrane protein TMEM260 (protein O-mannosyltransferase)